VEPRGCLRRQLISVAVQEVSWADPASSLLPKDLFAAIDVKGRTRQCRVGHDVNNECGHILWFHNPPDGQGSAKLCATGGEIVAEQ
jgi:hypothetical protein